MTGRPNGRAGHIGVEKTREVMSLISRGIPRQEIVLRTQIPLRIVSAWANRWNKGQISEGMSRADAHRPTQLCLVNGCHDHAHTGKFCELHLPRPPASHVPLARLMAGR